MPDRLFHTNINVMDLDVSIAFYAILGFSLVHRQRLDGATMESTARELGTNQSGAEFALVRLGDEPGAAFLDLVQWDDVIDRAPHPANERGAARIAILVDDLDDARQRLEAAGFPPLGPAANGTMFVVRDPDGLFVELASGLEY